LATEEESRFTITLQGEILRRLKAAQNDNLRAVRHKFKVPPA
jgi:hypothetical protein